VDWERVMRVALIVSLPICLLNITVAAVGHSRIFPLSPFFLGAKLRALGNYGLHRPKCALFSHPPLAPLIAAAETRHRLPRGLLAAVVQVETGGEPHSISSAGAMGLGQLVPSTARAMGVGDPFDSAQGLEGSARYLAGLLGTFHDIRLAVAAYNAGPGAIVHRTVPHNGQTEIYVQRVMHAYRLNRPRAASKTRG
jgi:soluble lytic murein transglycosylase-like protein